jgi:predicted kinase
VPTLHFIYGPPAAGKTSLARQLAANVPATLFCEDEYLARRPEAIASLAQLIEALREVRGVIGPQAIAALQHGRSVVFDFGGNTVAHRAWVRGIAAAAGAELLLHVLDVPLEECRRRLRERNVARPAGLYFGDVSDELFDEVVKHIVMPGDGEGIPNVRVI